MTRTDIHEFEGDAARRRGQSLPGASAGFMLLLLIPWNAALVYLDIAVGGRSLPGMLWVGFIPALAVAFPMEARLAPHARIALPYANWLVWSAWVWASLVWCDVPGLRAVQDAMQLTLPIAIGMFSSLAVRRSDHLETLLRSVCASGAFVVAIAVLSRTGILARLGIATDDRSSALYAVLVGAVLLAHYPPRAGWAAMGWAAMLLPALVTGSRMATAVYLSLPMFHPRLSIRARLLSLVVLALIGWTVFQSAGFQHRFFGEAGTGTLAQVMRGEFLSFGRFENWPAIWREARARPWLGHGAGYSAAFVPKVWENMTHPHNDYLRVFLEFGSLGFVIFGFAAATQYVALHRLALTTRGAVRRAYTAAMLGWWGFLLTSLTDNTLVYNAAYMSPLFMLVGAAYGTAFHKPREAANGLGA
ncbi:MAG: O-antigen ligase family protein [Planctomycetes bacterium]|nr:O-antigen ligase family protein [Planctomycetota bacterium]